MQVTDQEFNEFFDGWVETVVEMWQEVNSDLTLHDPMLVLSEDEGQQVYRLDIDRFAQQVGHFPDPSKMVKELVGSSHANIYFLATTGMADIELTAEQIEQVQRDGILSPSGVDLGKGTEVVTMVAGSISGHEASKMFTINRDQEKIELIERKEESGKAARLI